MDDPFDFLRTGEVGILLLVGTAAAITWSRLFPQLKTKNAPGGIISLQLAFSAKQAACVIDSWRRRRLDGAARRSLRTDLGFILFYACSLVLLASLAGRAAGASNLLGESEAETVAAALAIAAGAAALLDVLENFGLWLQLTRRPTALLTAATSAVSAAKWFVALGSGLTSLALLAASI